VTATLFLVAALGAGAGLGGFVGWRAWRALPPLPEWTWRNIMALIALVATIAGAAVLSMLAWWLLGGFGDDADRLITELVRDPKARPEVGQVLIIIYEAMAWGLKLLLGGVLVVLLSLGLAITPRRIRIDKTGADLSGGDDALPVTVTNTDDQPVPVEPKP
jgi:hypothetical protein